MILRNAAVRHGRRTLATSLTRSLPRQLSTETSTPTETQTPAEQSAWPTSQPAPAPPKIGSASRKKQRIVLDTILSLRTDSAHEHKGKAWTSEHKTANAATSTPAEQYAEFQRIQKVTRTLGSNVERRYVPSDLVINPPGPEDVSLELLMASQTHLGHSTSLWNPANSRYIYGVRDGIHIISLETTAAHLRRAARVVEEVAYQGGLILIVGTRKGQMEIVTRAAELAGACHLFTKWTPGGITNRDVILGSHGTKVVDHNDQELPDFGKYQSSARPLLPDLVICLNPLENYTLLYECGLKSIPTIGVIDTNADPSWVTYTIPANDDSLRAMGVVAGVLGRAGEVGQKRRRADAAQGKASWSNPEEIDRHMRKEIKVAIQERKAVMGRLQQKVEGLNEEERNLIRQGYESGELQITEEDMMDMLGEAAIKSPGESDTMDKLVKVEELLAGAKKDALAVEADIHASSGLSTSESGPEVTVAPTNVAKSIEEIEGRLDGLKVDALAMEAEIKANSEKPE